KHQKSIPDKCNLSRLKLLRVCLQFFTPVAFGALIEAMVYPFSGVQKLIVDVNESKKPFDDGEYIMVLERAENSTSLSEIELNLDGDCSKFQEDSAEAVACCNIALKFGYTYVGRIWD
ncbi:hypothetical protein HDU76_007389, partial [Blyttiomyces sp. JEL0837]